MILSIITPSFNQGAFLAEAIENVICFENRQNNCQKRIA